MDSLKEDIDQNPFPEEAVFIKKYNAIIADLYLSPEHRPGGISSTPHSLFLPSLTIPQLNSSEQMRVFVRDRLSHELSTEIDLHMSASDYRYVHYSFTIL